MGRNCRSSGPRITPGTTSSVGPRDAVGRRWHHRRCVHRRTAAMPLPNDLCRSLLTCVDDRPYGASASYLMPPMPLAGGTQV
jgi:hypothetical protein